MQKNYQTMTNMQDNANSYQLTLKEEFEQRREEAEMFYDELDNISDAIDNFINNKQKCYDRSDFLCSLLQLELKLHFFTPYAVKHIKTTPQLLRATSRRQHDWRNKVDALDNAVRESDSYFDSSYFEREYTDEALNSLSRMIFNKRKNILQIIKPHILSLYPLKVRLTKTIVKNNYIPMLWSYQLARYESDNAELYESFCHNVINAEESLRELDKERERNEDIELWYRKPEPCEFIKTLRAQADKVELDLLPVFDYEIKRRRLLDMMRAEPLKSGGKIVFYGNIYNNGPTENKIDIHSNEHVVINPNLRTMTYNHGER